MGSADLKGRCCCFVESRQEILVRGTMEHRLEYAAVVISSQCWSSLTVLSAWPTMSSHPLHGTLLHDGDDGENATAAATVTDESDDGY